MRYILLIFFLMFSSPVLAQGWDWNGEAHKKMVVEMCLDSRPENLQIIRAVKYKAYYENVIISYTGTRQELINFLIKYSNPYISFFDIKLTEFSNTKKIMSICSDARLEYWLEVLTTNGIVTEPKPRTKPLF